MLADQQDNRIVSGALDISVHLPGEWLNSLMTFIASTMPGWRDDPKRPAQTNENGLSAQLCSRLNSACRHDSWDFLQFKREEPDEGAPQRSIDLAVAPRATTIWIEGREYSEYRTLLPIECKRLPTPTGTKRDKREYIYSKYSTTGGIQRFKAGHHGSLHRHAAMIGFIQDHDIAFWLSCTSTWIDGLVNDKLDGWSDADKLAVMRLDSEDRIASLRSTHSRQSGLSEIVLDHLWIEM